MSDFMPAGVRPPRPMSDTGLFAEGAPKGTEQSAAPEPAIPIAKLREPVDVVLVDDAVAEINQRWGEPWGEDVEPLPQDLVRETAEAILALAPPDTALIAKLREFIEARHAEARDIRNREKRGPSTPMDSESVRARSFGIDQTANELEMWLDEHEKGAEG